MVKRRRPFLADINVTPFVDVMLVLLTTLRLVVVRIRIVLSARVACDDGVVAV